MLDNLSEDLKKIFLVGVGAAAVTAEKSKELIDELVRKGTFTVEEGKKLNEELKYHRKEVQMNNLKEKVNKMSEEELAELKALIEAKQGE